MKHMQKNAKKQKSKRDDFMFDDCPVCQAMKKADEQGRELSLPELKKAFAKANKKSKFPISNSRE